MKKNATFLLAIGLASCAAPKADVVVEATQDKALTPLHTPTETAQVSPENIKPTLPIVRNTGLRLPDMLELPQDEQLRSVPDSTNDGKATIIARPPEE